MLAAKKIDALVEKGHGVLSVDTNATVLGTARKMRYHHVGCLVVTDEHQRAAGVVTERDLVDKVLAEGKDPKIICVKDIMSENVISIDQQTSITKAQTLMAKNSIRHLPIIEDGLLLGMISSRDIMAYQFAAVKAVLDQQKKMIQSFEEEFPNAA